jgi:predicted dienelactone hydrolase
MGKLRLQVVPVLVLNFLTLLPLAAQGGQTILHLPPPDGCHQIGTTTVVFKDRSRKRDLLVTLWYPSLRGSVSAPYMDKGTAAAIAEDWDLQPDFADRVRTNADLGPPLEKGGPFPLVLLEHGSDVVPATYTILAEELASHGFVVAATNHPPDSLIAVFPDGRELRAKPYWPENGDRRTQGIAIGKFAEDVLVEDVRFVLDTLQDMNARDTFWQGHINMSKIGIVGHSMGGTTAAIATKEELRISADVNLDGSTFPGMNNDVRPMELNKPLLFLATEEHAADPGSHAREYSGSKSNTYYVVVPGADHMSFTDKRLIQSRFLRESKQNNISWDHALLAVEITRTLVGEFLGKYLTGDPAPSLDSPVHVVQQ